MSANSFISCLFPSRRTTNWEYVRLYWVFYIIMLFIFGVVALFGIQFLPMMGIGLIFYFFRGRIMEKLGYIFLYSCLFIAIQVVVLIFLSYPYWMFIINNIKKSLVIIAVSAFVVGNIFHCVYFWPKLSNYIRHIFCSEELIEEEDLNDEFLITGGINNSNSNHNHNNVDDNDDSDESESYHHRHHHHHHHNNGNRHVHHTVLNNIHVYTSIPIDDEEFEEARRLQLIHDTEQQRRRDEENQLIMEQLQYSQTHNNFLQPTVCIIPPDISNNNITTTTTATTSTVETRDRRVSSSNNVYVNNTSSILHCAVCGMPPLTFAVMNCGHMCLCENCKLGYELQREKYCPMCSQPIDGYLKVYDSEDANCVICLTEPITHAIVPCGHFCIFIIFILIN